LTSILPSAKIIEKRKKKNQKQETKEIKEKNSNAATALFFYVY